MRKKRTLIVILIPVAVVFVMAFFYSILFLSFVRVPTGAMKNTILVGDRVVANRINRDNSEDSRYFGTIPANLIVAKALAIYWSQEPNQSGGRIRWNRIFKRLK